MEKLLTLVELEKQKNKLFNLINEIRLKEQELKVGEFKNKIGKYYKFNGGIYEGYIQITNIWASKEEIYLEGLHFYGEFIEDFSDCHYSEYSAFRQFSYGTINKWEDFHLEEISRDEFEYAFAVMLDKAQDRFYKFLK